MTGRQRHRLQLISAAVGVASIAVVSTLIALNLLIGNKQIDRPLNADDSVESPTFERTMSTVLSPALVDGNSVQVLVNGDQIFPAMLAAIRSAKKSVTIETYIYWSGEVGQQFAQALEECAGRGVKVDVLMDWYGSEMQDDLLERMRKSGIAAYRYNPPTWTTLEKVNHRTHRRLMVVDGTIGFIGGAGLSDKWSGDAQGPDHWRDTHFRVEGPVVAQLQSAFLDNWIKTTGEVPHGDGFLPELESRGSSRAHVFKASPGGGSKSMQLMFLLSISSAQRSIDISAAYFLPDEVAPDFAVERDEARRPRARHHARAVHGRGARPPLVTRQVGCAAGRRRRALPVPADDVPLQGDGDRRSLVFGRLDELRYPLVHHQRRGQPERVRPDAGRAADRRLRG